MEEQRLARLSPLLGLGTRKDTAFHVVTITLTYGSSLQLQGRTEGGALPGSLETASGNSLSRNAQEA